MMRFKIKSNPTIKDVEKYCPRINAPPPGVAPHFVCNHGHCENFQIPFSTVMSQADGESPKYRPRARCVVNHLQNFHADVAQAEEKRNLEAQERLNETLKIGLPRALPVVLTHLV